MSAAYDSGMHMSTLQPQPQQNLAYAHDSSASHQQAAALQTMSAPTRKRGRPRKYVDSSIAMPLAIMPAPHSTCGVPPGFPSGLRGWPPVMPSPLPPPPPSANATQRVKKRRVRAPSSTATTKKQRKVTAEGSGVIGIIPEVITMQVGQDVATKIMSLSGNGWAVCIMSAHGAVSNVTLRQGASSRGTVTYEGYFEMISLCGFYQPSESDGMSSRTGGLSVLLAGHNGRPFGGGVEGPMTAASPVHVVIGRFPVDEKKKLKRAATGDIPGASSSTSGVALNGSSGRPRSPLNWDASGSFNTSSHLVLSNLP